MTLSSKERAELRAEAHHLAAMVHVGHQGITPTLLESLDDALRTRELVKIQLSRNADTKAKDAAHEIASAAGAEVVQVIGRTMAVYRENPDLPRKPGALPPWKQG